MSEIHPKTLGFCESPQTFVQIKLLVSLILIHSYIFLGEKNSQSKKVKYLPFFNCCQSRKNYSWKIWLKCCAQTKFQSSKWYACVFICHFLCANDDVTILLSEARKNKIIWQICLTCVPIQSIVPWLTIRILIQINKLGCKFQ